MGSTDALTRLPVLDLRQVTESADADAAAAFRADLLAAARDVGFFYLTGHELSPAQEDEMVRLARELFALPERDKQAIAMTNSPHFRGWTRLGGERTQGRQDWREQIDIGTESDPVPPTSAAPWNVLNGPNQWPAALPELQPAVQRWRATLAATGAELTRQFALALGQAPEIFDATFEPQASSLLKIIHYPPPVEGSTDDQGVGAHKDAGFLTLLFIEAGKPGLQVEHEGRWIDAPPVPGAVVVNLGELLEVATQGLLKATVHRVVSPERGQDRISIAFFHNPEYAARVPTLTLPPDLANQARGVTQDAANALHDTYGANALKSRLRAHPDVAAVHHPDLLLPR